MSGFYGFSREAVRVKVKVSKLVTQKSYENE